MPGVAMAFDDKRWEETIKRLRPLLRLLAAGSLNDRYWRQVDPSDIVQKTILEAHQNRADFRGSSDHDLEAWLKGILGHRIIDEARRLRCLRNDVDREVEMERAEEQVRKWTSPLSALLRHEEAFRLAEALEKLPDDQRRAVEFMYFLGLTLSETADRMEMNRYAVLRLLKRGQDKLRELLKDTR